MLSTLDQAFTFHVQLSPTVVYYFSNTGQPSHLFVYFLLFLKVGADKSTELWWSPTVVNYNLALGYHENNDNK